MTGHEPFSQLEPDSLDELCEQLANAADSLPDATCWPTQQLNACAQQGVFRWFLDRPWGGWNWDESQIVAGYLRLSAACLTTTFVITQRTAACKRIAASENEWLKSELLPDLASGARFSTVGISHLTTSRRHLGKPVMAARMDNGKITLHGYAPWVTGAPFAETAVVGATMDDGREILVALPTDLPGVECPPTPELVGLSASRTGKLICDHVVVEDRYLVAGPVADIMRGPGGGATGGLQTSTLALGLSDAAISYLERQIAQRDEFSEPADALRADFDRLRRDLFQLVDGGSGDRQQLRSQVNSLALRATQAALVAAKGAGYVAGHPTGRWCREALFFLVWSCPQEVLASNLCEFAGIIDD